MTLGERIKKVRKELDLTQQDFASRFGSTQNVLANYESGRRNPSAAALDNICKTFNVSKEWLRTGEEPMFLLVPKEDELATAVNKLLSGESSAFKTRLIKILADLKPQQWEVLEGYVLKLSQNNPAQPLTLEQEVEQEVERYRQHLLSEKKQASQASSAKESGAG